MGNGKFVNNTLVRALNTAANLKGYEKNLKLYPNLEYLHTRAAVPDGIHESYVGTVLPFHHPAWMWLMPPSRWGCLCSVRQTDKPVTGAPEKPDDFDPLFDNNAYLHASFVNIRQTPYYRHTDPELREAVIKEGQRLQAESQAAKEKIENSKKEYGRLVSDKNYSGIRFDAKTGAMTAIHKEHNFDREIGALGIARGEYERLAVNALFAKGNKIVLESEKSINGLKTPDGKLNGKIMDIKGIEVDGKYTIKNAFKKANRQGAEVVVLYFHDKKMFSEEKALHQWNLFENETKNVRIKEIVCVVQEEVVKIR
ncbi:CdiA C-terminal domain-containing protein [Viscerimonas tarda]